MTVGLILEALVAVLLVATVYYCVILNRRLTKLREGQEEFTALVADLNEATRRAQNSVQDLKSSTIETGRELEERVSSARVLVDELAMITEAGNNLANRLERQLIGASSSRSSGRSPGQLKQRLETSSVHQVGTGPTYDGREDISRNDNGRSEPRSETERELLRTLKEVR